MSEYSQEELDKAKELGINPYFLKAARFYTGRDPIHMNLPTPIHIPKGHELVKRYDPIRWSDMGGWSWDHGSIKDCEDGEYVRIEDVKSHLLKWLQEEHDKLNPDNRDEFSGGCRNALKAVQHHINILLFP